MSKYEEILAALLRKGIPEDDAKNIAKDRAAEWEAKREKKLHQEIYG